VKNRSSGPLLTCIPMSCAKTTVERDDLPPEYMLSCMDKYIYFVKFSRSDVVCDELVKIKVFRLGVLFREIFARQIVL
jgi:hypothetical protein